MLTYDLKKAPGVPLYEALYRRIRDDILSGALAAGEKLPSKRALAENLEISRITVEGAYSQLLAEGYIRSREKVGYFVEGVERRRQSLPMTEASEAPTEPPRVDLTGHGSPKFPFSVWSRLQRQVLLDQGEKLLLPPENQGCAVLREAIAQHLAQFRGMLVSPGQILVGAGTDFLYNLLIQLLGREKCYALEDPGYGKIRRIYAAGGVSCIGVPLDQQGVMPDSLENAQVLHISPSHHFPTGLVTTLERRKALLAWANAGPDRWIIEDDYDSEFRFHAHPLPAMQSLDPARVIYMNSFSKSLAPGIRVGFMVLPPALMTRFRQELGFYSCTVTGFEQYTLARFLGEGYFEKHINRMRKYYRGIRNRVIQALEGHGKLTVLEQDAGLHFLLRVDTDESDEALAARWAEAGIRIRTLSSYYHGPLPESDRHCLVVNYAGLDETALACLEKQIRAVL